MKKSRKFVVLILAMLFAAVSLSGTGLAVFDKTELSGGLYQLNVVHTITMESLDENIYTAWTSAMCFAAGKTEDGVLYFATDASLAEPDRIFAEQSDELLKYLENGGVFVDETQLSAYAVITATDYYLAYNGENIPMVPVDQSATDQVLFLTLNDPSLPIASTSFTYAYADLLRENETVYTFSLSGEEIDGIVPATQDAYVTHWSLATQEAQVQYPAAISDGSRALTYYTMAPNRGAQGGALFNSNGYLVGVNLWTNAYNGTTALTSSAVMAALDQLDVPYEIYESPTSNFSFSDIMVYVVILAAAVVVLIILLIVVRIRKKRLDQDDVSDLEQEAMQAREEMAAAQRAKRLASVAQKQAEESAARDAKTKEEQTKEARPSLPPVNRSQSAASPSSAKPSAPAKPKTAAPAAAAAAGTTAAAAAAGRNRQPGAGQNRLPMPKSVSLSFLNGAMKGMSVPVPEKVLIGRDPAVCNVIFPADVTAVSRSHCTVTFNRQTGRVLLEDVNSANGTYFPSGTRVIPGRLYSLRNGDRFYLGLQDNMAEVHIEYEQN